MDSTKNSTSTTPRSAVKVAITQRINTRLKNDLKELEKITMPKLPNKINLNITNLKQNVKSKTESNSSPRKNPTLKNEYVSIDELRSRAHHGSLGVIPVRNSKDFEDLKFMMKGSNVLKKEQAFDNLYPDEDEGINEPNSSGTEYDDYDENLHSNQNTPTSFYDTEIKEKIPNLTKQSYLQHFYSQPKPAILPSTGTSATAKFAERPKPQKKQKILLKTVKKTSQPDTLSLDSIKSESEQQQIELEKQVKSLVDEAKKIANIKKLKKTKNVTVVEEESVKGEISEEVKVVKGVEGLISAIKSGQLIAEQEQSNRKIQEILGTVLDKASLSLFDPSFSEHVEEEKEGDSNEKHSQVDSAIYPENSVRESLGIQSLKDLTDNNSTRDDKLSIEETQTIENLTIKSLIVSYQEEIDNYLASLPVNVTREDVLNTTATSIKLTEKPRKALVEKNPVEKTTDEKFARNLHLFCMLEHERRDSLLLPDELQDVTRKNHIRSKYENEIRRSSRVTDSFATQASTKFNEDFIAFNRTDKAAQRVFENLTEIMNFDGDRKSSMTSDSGFMDADLDMWKKEAEKKIEIEGKKMNLLFFDDYKEFTLSFLKPAPPKMSVKPSKIRERLFPEYKSMPPPVDDLGILSKKKSAKFKFYTSGEENSDERTSYATTTSDLDDDDSTETSAIEFQVM